MKGEATSLEYRTTGVIARASDLRFRAVQWGSGTDWSVIDLFSAPQSLDVLAAVACVEMLTENLLKPSPQAWLQTVKNLSMPLELLCSEGYMQDCGMMTRTLIRDIR